MRILLKSPKPAAPMLDFLMFHLLIDTMSSLFYAK